MTVIWMQTTILEKVDNKDISSWSHTLCPCGHPFFVGSVLPGGCALPQSQCVERKASFSQGAGVVLSILSMEELSASV